MATYEYVCMRCERFFEEQRSMTASVETALACPSCGSDRVKRRFSLFATVNASAASGFTTHPRLVGNASR